MPLEKQPAMGMRGAMPTPMSSMRFVGGAHHLGVVLCLAVLWMCLSPVLSSSQDDENGSKFVTLIPKMGKLGPLETIAFWQLPEGPVRKVFVLLEPKGNVPSDFWDRSPSCPICRGLPEKRKFIIDALSRNYAVFMPSSLDVAEGDWTTWPEDNPDLMNALTMINEWKKMQGLEKVPTVGLGSSAGGGALGTLALQPGMFESIAMVVSVGTDEAMEAATHEYPPTIFVHMPKDTHTADLIANAGRILGSKGVPTKEERWYEHPVNPDWFAQLIPGVDLALSTAIYNNVRAEGWLDEQTNLMTSDQYRRDWSDAMERWTVFPDNTAGLILSDSVGEELNVAFAKHWTVARKNDEIFAWLDGGYNSQNSGVATF